MRSALPGWWLPLLGAVLLASPARAASYEVEPDVDGALDLEAMHEDGAITGETLAALGVLRRSGVDLAHVTRESLYALPGLTYARVDGLLRGGEPAIGGRVEGFTEEELRRLAPFLARGTRGKVSGDARLLAAFAASDAVPPPLALQVRAEGPSGWRVGLLASLTRRRLGTVRRDARLRVLVAGAPGAAVAVPKLYAQGTWARARVLAGTYLLGFGQGLTLDTTGLPTPDGFLPDDGVRALGGLERRCFLGEGACSEEEGDSDVTPDFRWDEGFRGVAGTVRGPVGTGAELSLTGFGSYQSRSLPSHALLDRAACVGALAACRAPEVWLEGERAPVGKVVSRTLPGVFREWAGGGNATLSLSSRSRVGVTAWAARPAWAVEGAVLDFRPTAGYPSGGGFGAVGVDAAWGAGAVDLFFEGTRSFDGIPGRGGGFGALQRTVLTGERRELELTLRYYGHDFANPYTGAVSGPDELEGSRARNELGVRGRYVHRVDGAWRLRGQVDAWTLPEDGAVPGTAGAVHLRASARVDWQAWPLLQPSLWAEYRDKGVGEAGDCFDATDDAPCTGAQVRVTGRVKSDVSEALSVAAQYGHTRVDDPRAGGVRSDGHAVLDVVLRPREGLRLRGRLTWKDEDVSEATRLEQSLRTTLEVGWTVRPSFLARGRYAWVLDLKDPLGARTPPDPPRHLFQLELETRF